MCPFSWRPGCVVAPGLWPSVPVLFLGLVPSCGSGSSCTSSFFVPRGLFQKRGNDPKTGFSDRPTTCRAGSRWWSGMRSDDPRDRSFDRYSLRFTLAVGLAVGVTYFSIPFLSGRCGVTGTVCCGSGSFFHSSFLSRVVFASGFVLQHWSPRVDTAAPVIHSDVYHMVESVCCKAGCTQNAGSFDVLCRDNKGCAGRFHVKSSGTQTTWHGFCVPRPTRFHVSEVLEGNTTCENDVWLLPRQFDEKVATLHWRGHLRTGGRTPHFHAMSLWTVDALPFCPNE